MPAAENALREGAARRIERPVPRKAASSTKTRRPLGLLFSCEERRLRLHHVVEAQDFNRGMLEELFSTARVMEKVVEDGGSKLLDGCIMASLFYEESTRTRFSFETAMLRLGGSVISTENARQFSSVSKGETLEDTIRIMNGYADVIVMRHYESGAARRAADISRVPIVNAGDGTGQHPTQAFLDLYTIEKELGGIDNLTIAVVGDLANGRTVRSLCYLLAKYRNVRVYMVAPEVVRMREDIKDYLSRHDVRWTEESDLREVVGEVDVLYQTRIQKERFGDRSEDYLSARGVYVVDRELLKTLRKNAIVMHPLPRVDEITVDVDGDPRAAYFRQAQNGVFIRMALLAGCLGRDLVPATVSSSTPINGHTS
ncbi:MAG TPA: aspartate carbamoyltransferase [Chloroflexi bacterium]|nr:aspartate carbamoyltransferase [Chloroflexota bacterium]